MNQTESVKYVLKDYEFREVARGKGVVDYHLVDKFGNERLIAAMAKLNWRKQVSSVRPIHHRELPLIDALAHASLNETIEVDFSEFNKKYPRGSVRSKKIAVRNIKVSKHDKQHISSTSSLMDNKARLMQLVLLSMATFAAAMFVMNKI